MTGRSDRIVAASAGLIGIAALAISGYQAYIMRQQQRASVWPRVDLLTNDSDSSYSLSMTNVGIGPALLVFAEVSVDGKPRPSWRAVLDDLGGSGGFTQSRIADRVLIPGQSQDLFRSQDPPGIGALASGADRVEIRICYCSIYDECWLVSRSLRPGARMPHAEVRACVADERRRFDR